MSKVKIAYFLDRPRGFGGAGNLLLQQANLMSAIYDVIVVIPCNEEGIPNEEYIRRCELRHLPYSVLRYCTAFNFYDVDFLSALEDWKQIADFVVRENITFLHSVQLNIAVEMVARELCIPHLMNIYQLQPDEFKLLHGDLYPQYHLCDSELYSTLWKNKLGIVSRCIRPVAPLEQQVKKDYNLQHDFVICMLGGISERKNQLTAIKVVEKCLEKFNIQLKIAGSTGGKYADLCKKYIEEGDLEDRIQFLGFVKDVSGLLKSCDCLLCTSLDESFPSSMVEAVTYDLTIVTTPVAGVPEIFKDHVNSFVSKDFSINSICQSLIECLESYQNGSIGSVHLNEEYTWRKYFAPNIVGEQIGQYYESIINGFVPKENVFDGISKVVNNAFQLLKPVHKKDSIVKKHCLYYSLLMEKLKSGKAYIWGAGNYGGLAKGILEKTKPDIEIIGFIDQEKEGTYLNIPIIHPMEIRYMDVQYIFIGFGSKYNQNETIEFLRERRFEYNDKVWLLP